MIKQMIKDHMGKTTAEEIGLKIDIPIRTKVKLNKFGTTEKEYLDAIASRKMIKMTERVMDVFINESTIGGYLKRFMY